MMAGVAATAATIDPIAHELPAEMCDSLTLNRESLRVVSSQLRCLPFCSYDVFTRQMPRFTLRGSPTCIRVVAPAHPAKQPISGAISSIPRTATRASRYGQTIGPGGIGITKV